MDVSLPIPSRFPAEAPADDIHVLIAHLREQDPSAAFLYRGQTKHYDTFVPSVYRRLVKPGASGPILEIDADAFWPGLDERRRLRFQMMNRMIRRMGKGVGNIVAQQYGLSSEAIDITSDIEIAAFFATRDYPAYDHFAGTPENGIGVIYRFPRAGVKPKHLDGLDNVTDSMVIKANGVQALVPFYSKRTDLSPELAAKTDAAIAANGGPMTAQLATLPVVLDHVQLEMLLTEALDRTRYAPRRRYHLTRLARQKGGFIRPPVQWLCTIPRNFEIIDEPRFGGRIMVPTLAIAEKLVGVENTMYFPGMQAFFFRHTKVRVESVSRRTLWPSSQEDKIYDRLLIDVAMTDSDYFEPEDRLLDGQETGVVDRGYYTGAEPVARQASLLYDKGEYGAAVEKYTEALAIDPEDDWILAGRASAWFESGDYARAAADYEQVVKLNPDSAAGWNGLGMARLQQESFDEALAALNAALEHDPHMAQVWFNRGTAFGALRRYAEADRDFAEAVRLDSKLKVRVAIHQALMRTDGGDDDAAETYLRQLDEWGEDTARLRSHIAGMRERRRPGS